MAGGQPRGRRRQIYERLSPRQVRRGSKQRGRAAMGAPGGSPPQPHPGPPSLPRLYPASPDGRLPPGGGPPLLPVSGGGGGIIIIIIILRVTSELLHPLFPPSSALHRVLFSSPAKARRGRPGTHRRGERGSPPPSPCPGPPLRGAPGPVTGDGRTSPRAPPFPEQRNAASLLHHRPLLARGLTDHGAAPPQVAKRTRRSAVAPGTA